MSEIPDNKSLLEIAGHCLRQEAEALQALQGRLGESFLKAVEMLRSHNGKIVICGMGKSGHIAQKIAATLSSTGTPTIFLHAGEARHGDLGIYHPGDPTILISKSGSTAEIVHLIPVLKDFNSPIIAIVGNLNSEIARCADAVLDASVAQEADPLGLAPTASTVTALAMGDALASALMAAKGFQGDDFARLHPAGQLGRNLLNRVADVMKTQDEVAWLSAEATLREVVIALTRFPQGACCVVDADSRLLGIITDGDIRRMMEKTDDFHGVRATDIMTADPITVLQGSSLADALKLMEDRPRQIYVLPVLDDDSSRCLGLLRLHDVYQPQWK
ncbi:KpsF/GutQ family sugar-phosphate isomerase [Rubellicoccus peritrichatus]|uniref:KpsF/GutQ family sugar-phosphate isomerase n=1 Tax=Rubellicoccus peritrichatus TaxID=3080537 RepID=A0AAQ3LA88_9BACT|nr:KpsF/GutQ family sugar-phosphate isomerase [Puniceicoccus sp. CR14]WOO42155.1 KpsF/GutQ family sugar-phosphate isomerase [Puniceicoccus sp. CR14]